MEFKELGKIYVEIEKLNPDVIWDEDRLKALKEWQMTLNNKLVRAK